MLKQEQVDTVLNWVATACDIADIEAPEVAFDLQGKTAGWYLAKTDRLRINTDISARYWDEDLQGVKDVVLHELAHAIDYKRNGGRFSVDKNGKRKWIHHDELFRTYMLEIGGVDTSTTHNFKTVAVRKQRRWSYACECTDSNGNPIGIKVSTVIHNRIQKKNHGRICKACKFHFNKEHFLQEAV